MMLLLRRIRLLTLTDLLIEFTMGRRYSGYSIRLGYKNEITEWTLLMIKARLLHDNRASSLKVIRYMDRNIYSNVILRPCSYHSVLLIPPMVSFLDVPCQIIQ